MHAINSLSYIFLLVRDISPVETGIFFWSFVIIISLVLFNMVLAVILNVYEEKYNEVARREKDQNKGDESRLKKVQ